MSTDFSVLLLTTLEQFLVKDSCLFERVRLFLSDFNTVAPDGDIRSEGDSRPIFRIDGGRTLAWGSGDA